MKKDTARAFFEELDKISPKLRQAFEEAIADITSTAQIKMLEDAIKAGDVQRALLAIRLDESFFAPFDRAISEAYYQGGVYQMARLPKRISTGSGNGPLVIRFNGRNPRAEAWLANHSSTLIREITEDQRALVRNALTEGMRLGRNPRATALDLVGRIDGNRRKGGLIGLHSRQAMAVQNMRFELSDPDFIGGYFSRKKRDRRFDRTVAKAMREGRALNRDQIDKIAGRYADRLLKHRGDMIARTETLTALNAGRMEGLEQLVERGDVPREAIKVVWDATGDSRTRPDHAEIDGQEITFGEAFVFPDGSRVRCPGDTSLGAGGHQTINCRCYAKPKIDYLAMAK
jgi:hypothetical protein